MWLTFAEKLRCPVCRGPLALRTFRCTKAALDAKAIAAARERGMAVEACDEYVEAGVLLCEGCRVMYPVFQGLPVMLTYRTGLHDKFASDEASRLAPYYACRFPDQPPASGERAVMNSFSKEWLDYDYDGVMWEMSYADHERRFLQEIGPALMQPAPRTFLEIGCGLGVTTQLAHKNAGVEAVGLDLSLAVLKACRHYRANPFLHFVQASVFALPFAEETFDVIYSRGVLHHTMSTESAFESAARLCSPGGTLYVWVYGMGSIRETLFRRAVYGFERMVRPALSEKPDSPAARAFLAAMGTGYVLFNRMRRVINPSIQPLTVARGVHAARDRFTPKYAHRHEVAEVTGWFRRAQFGGIEVLDWKTMPAADHDDFRRNVGVRATRLQRDGLEAAHAH